MDSFELNGFNEILANLNSKTFGRKNAFYKEMKNNHNYHDKERKALL